MGLFGRPDGKKIKGIGGFERMLSLIIGRTRNETTNLFHLEILAKPIDEFIQEKQKQGIQYTYRDVAIATLVRVFYLRPRLNRFVIAGKFYQRKHIDVAMTVHKNLRTGEGETAIKCRFTGKETIEEIKKQLDEKIDIAMNATNQTDIFTNSLNWTPTWLFRMIVRFLRGLDRLGWLSDKFLFETSPMHSSIFFADLKSIHLDRVYHHLYNFGNCGFFGTMGKEQLKPIADEATGEIRAERVIGFGFSVDERFIDGYYYSGMLKLIRRILDNLSTLEREPHDDEIKKEKSKKDKSRKK